MAKEENNSKKTKVIGVVSFKGGVGKTSFAVNLACALANLNKKVLAVDSNFSSPNLSLHFGLLNPPVTLKEVISDKAEIHEAVYVHNSNVHIIPSSPLSKDLNITKFRENINKIKKIYEFVLLDCSPSLDEGLIAALSASDEIVIVTTSDYPTLTSAMRAANIAKEKKLNVKGIILNRVRGKKFELSKKDIEEATGVPVIAILPEDEKVIEASSNLMPLMLYSPYRKVSNEYRKIASSFCDERYAEESMMNRMKRAVIKQLNQINGNFQNIQKGVLEKIRSF